MLPGIFNANGTPSLLKNDPFHFHVNQTNGNEPPLDFRFLPRPDDRHGQLWDEDLTEFTIFKKTTAGKPGGGFLFSTESGPAVGQSKPKPTKTNHEQYEQP